MIGKAQLTGILLLVACFSLATSVGPQLDRVRAGGEDGALASMLGESRRLFANHFFTRSDVYFHSGYYPGIFDQGSEQKENHLAETAGAHEAKNPGHGEPGHVHDEHEEEDFLGAPRDPMDRFTRHFFITTHTHLTEKGTNAPKEILPWIKLASQLDPNKVDSYTVGAFWLRQLNRNDDAELFLREGLRRNPRSYEIMLELGRGSFEKGDYVRARNVLEMAMQCWREQENPKPVEQQNRFSAQQIIDYLARIEDRTGRREQVLHWLGILKKVSPHPDAVEKRMEEVRAGKRLEAGR